MSYWDKNPNIFKVIISSIGLLFFALLIINFYQNISPTDENRYTDIQNRIITSKTFFVKKLTSNGIIWDSLQAQTAFYKIDTNQIYSYPGLISLAKKYKSPIKVLVVPLTSMNVDTLIFDDIFEIPDTSYFQFIDKGARILDVLKGGASYRAGLKSGDIITSVNGNRFNNVFEADSMMRHSKKNHIIYTVFSDGKFKTTEVILAKYGVKLSFLSLMISGAFAIFLGWFIAFFRSRLISARITGFALMLLGVLLAVLVSVNPYFPIFQYVKSVIILSGVSFIIPVFMHSAYYFPKYNEFLVKRNWIVLVSYLIAALATITLNISVFVIDSTLSNLYLLIVFGIQIFYGAVIHFTFRKRYDNEIRKMSQYIDFATFILVSVLAINVISSYNGWYQINEYIMTAIIIFPLSYLITIGRYRLLDINIRFKRNIQYGLIAIVWKIALILLAIIIMRNFLNFNIDLPNIHFTGTSFELLEKPLKESQQIYYDKVIFLIISIIIVYLFYKLSNAGVEYLDKIFNRTKLDFRKAISKLMKMLENNIRLEELSVKITKNIAEIFQLKRVGFIIFDKENKVFSQDYYGINEEEIKEFIELISDKLQNAVNEITDISGIDYLPDSIRQVFHSCEFLYILPLKIKNNSTGVILIGEKLSESSFSPEELEYFFTIASQAAVAIENAFLYEDLAQKERMKHELEIARKIQLASLPQKIPAVEGLDISGLSLPAFEVGGDFYDLLNGRDNDITVVVGDVSGKGTSAALYMSKVQGIIRTLHEFALKPDELLIRTNNQLYGNIEKTSFISAIAAGINSKNKSYSIARAGHHPLYHYSAITKQILRVMPKGLALGIANNDLFSTNIELLQMNYSFQDVIVIITDGVLEAGSDEGDEFGEYRLMKIIKDNAHKSSSMIKHAILDAVNDFAKGSEQFDDITIVVIKAV